MPDGPWANYQTQSAGPQAAGPWAKYGGASPPPAPPAAAPAQPGFLDKEIPLDSYKNATLSGVQSIGRGFRGIGQAVAHPIESIKGMADIPKQVSQVPDAIHDINQSADPMGTYAKVGQETAGQGAAQAITALGTEGLARGVAIGAKPVLRGVGKVAPVVSDALKSDTAGLLSPRLPHAGGVVAKVGRIASKLGEDKAVFPGASLPEKPPSELLQARGLERGGSVPPPSPSAGLGKIPVRGAELGSKELPIPTDPIGPFQDHPMPVAKPSANADALETRGIQEEMRDAGEAEDRARLNPEARAHAPATKGELIREANQARGVDIPDKPVRLTKSSVASPKGSPDQKPFLPKAKWLEDRMAAKK